MLQRTCALIFVKNWRLGISWKISKPTTCAQVLVFSYLLLASKELLTFLGNAVLGVHRPFLSDSELRNLSGNQAIASANQLRTAVENYLKEMNVPAKYAELMFSVPKDKVRWIDEADFEGDLEGFILELSDWIDARCDSRTDVEKAAWESLKDKSPARMTPTEKSISDMLVKKMSELHECGSNALSGLSHEAYLKMFWEPGTAPAAPANSAARMRE